MRFSLRTILIAFILVGLTLATILSALKLQQANEEVARVRKVYGLGGPNRYRATFIGVSGNNAPQSDVCHLIQIDDPDGYAIDRVSYNENGVKSLDETIPLAAQDIEFVIWCNRNGNIRFESLKGSPVIWTSYFEAREKEVIGYHPYSSVDGNVSEGPFLVYVFCSPEVREITNMREISLDEEKLKAWCIKHKARSICFEFEKLKK